MKDSLEVKTKNFSFLGKKNFLKGEFHFSGNTRISSQLEGELFIGQDGALFLEQDAVFKGNIHCHNVHIFGSFEGQIESQGKVIIHSSAMVSGQIRADQIAIYPGAVVNIDGTTPEN